MKPNPETLKLLIQRYVAGEHTYKLAAELDVWPSVLNKWLKKEGVVFRPRGNKNGLTPTKRDNEIERLVVAGVCVRAIAKQLKVSSATIAVVIQERGLPRHTKRHLLSAAQIQEGLALYKNGSDYRGLAAKYGVSTACISDALRGAGLKPRAGWAKYRVHPWQDRKGRWYRFKSLWELKYAELLDLQLKDWDYEPIKYKLKVCKCYTPDFVVYGLDVVPIDMVDVKGWLDVRTTNRLIEFVETYPHLPLRLLGCTELVDLGLIDRVYLTHPMVAKVQQLIATLEHRRKNACPSLGN
jgi:hypothetical protein